MRISDWSSDVCSSDLASKERRALNQGVHIVVGTPGRLRDHLERGALGLSALRVAVLDEADEMLDMGFRDDLEGILDDRKSVAQGKRVSVRVDLGGRGIIKQKQHKHTHNHTQQS